MLNAVMCVKGRINMFSERASAYALVRLRDVCTW